MKTRSCLRSCASLALSSAIVWTVPAVADGEVDLGFAPPQQVAGLPLLLSEIEGRLYCYSPVSPVFRLRDDGSVDTDWKLSAPVGSSVIVFAGLPSGGWVMNGQITGFLDHGDGSYVRCPSFSPRLFPQEDGSVITFVNDTGIRRTPDGLTDPSFRTAALSPVDFSDNAGFSKTGAINPNFPVVQDSHGRLVLGGNLRLAGSDDRVGLLRLLPDGSPDPAWNPGPGLGLGTAASFNALPESLSLGPDDSVLVKLRLKSTNGQPDLRFVLVDKDGVAGQPIVDRYNSSDVATPKVQADGKIIVGGSFTNWGDVPIAGLVRLNPDGSVDPSFTVRLTRAGSPTGVFDMTLDQAGRLWVSGSFDSVNGIARPGLVRVQAYTPAQAAPVARITVAQPKVATNEVLYLTAQVQGEPSPSLQWFRDGAAIPGATHRGLRLVITNGADVGEFSLVISNALGKVTVPFPAVALAVRSPRPGSEDFSFDHPLTNFVRVTQLVALPTGGALVGGSGTSLDDVGQFAMVGRLGADGRLDPGFGDQGVVYGNGGVESLRLLPDGDVLVAGHFTELAGAPASGLAELDSQGRRVERAFPTLDVPFVSTAQRLPDGGYVLAGIFTRIGGVPAYRLARLKPDLSVDLAFHSPLERWQFVDDLASDANGRLLIAGERIFTDVTLTNAPSTGLQRLLADGAPDPGFQPVLTPVRTLWVEADGSILVGMPPRRVDADGKVLVQFDWPSYQTSYGSDAFGPDHRFLDLDDGGAIYPIAKSLLGPFELWRWQASGQRDYGYTATIGTQVQGPVVQAMAAMSDGSIWVSTQLRGTVNATPPIEVARRLRRIAPDSDLRMSNVRVSGGRLTAALETQAGRAYKIQRRSAVDSGILTPVADLAGDGYLQEVSVPADTDEQFLRLDRK